MRLTALQMAACLMVAPIGVPLSAQTVPGPAARPVYQLRGQVLSLITGAPVAHTHLVATRVRGAGGGTEQSATNATPRPGDQPTAETDTTGKFVLQLSRAGAYRVVASAPGFETTALDEHNGFSSSVVVSAAIPAIEVTFHIAPESRISGIIVDEANEGVRQATVHLWRLRPADLEQPAGLQRLNQVQTDDRGFFEFGGLHAGNYEVSVEAKPWYALSAQPMDRAVFGQPAPNYPEPSLDVVYPITWYPGFDSPDQAEPIKLKPGEERTADFHLIPQPALHIRIAPAPSPAAGAQRAFVRGPQLSLDQPGGTQSYNAVTQYLPDGGIDIGGLVPGVYTETESRNDGTVAGLRHVRIAAGRSNTEAMSEGDPFLTVTLLIEGAEAASIQSIQFTDVQSGRTFSTSTNPRNGFRGSGPPPREDPQEAEKARPITLQAPAGTYRIGLNSRGGMYLADVSAQGADAAGRQVTLHGGAPTVTLHVKQGRATVEGFVRLPSDSSGVAGKPSVGAEVLLVPATLGIQGSIDFVRRDQSNTDGSYDIAGVIPGKYILIAIDHGWDLNLTDPSTLTRYLLHGVPLELGPNMSVKQDLEAQLP